MVGRTISHYQILEKIGEGGMGVVYKALDTRLDRLVAIKVLPTEAVANPERKRRFAQEARSASSLNHPNIVHIYDIGSDDGVDFIAMEYIAGVTLDQCIPNKGMRLNEVLRVSVQIADALSAAHEAGVIHRDLKPGNIMIGDDRRVRVLDFGLAKLTEAEPLGPEGSTQTISAPNASPQTAEGTILGTVAYVSPEQAEGRKVDARSDIFSFGCLLYEMVTGRRAFRGDSNISTLAAVIKDEPRSARELTEDLPRDVDRIILRCLKKNPERRFQVMKDLKVELEELKEESDSGTLMAAPERAERRQWKPLLLGALAATVVVAAAGWYWYSNSRPGTAEPQLTAVPLTSYPGNEMTPALSPDGSQVAFSWNGEGQDNYDIYVQVVGAGEPLRLTDSPAFDWAPAWSPDGREILFYRYWPEGKFSLVSVPPLPGRERTLSVYPFPPKLPTTILTFLGPAWSPDGVHTAHPSETGLVISPGIESISTLTDMPGGAELFPSFAPDGRSIAFVWQAHGGNSDLCLLPLSAEFKPDGEVQRLVTGMRFINRPVWTPDSREIIFSANSGARMGLWRVEASGRGEPRRMQFTGGDASYPSLSRDGGRLAYEQRTENSNIWRVGLGARGSSAQQITSSMRSDWTPSYSPDGSKIAFISDRTGSLEVWMADADGSGPVQLTSLGQYSVLPEWSPDGRQIVFQSAGDSGNDLYLVGSEGGGLRRLTTDSGNEMQPSWSADGRWIYFLSDRSGANEIWRMPSEGGDAERVTPDGGEFARVSPDGKDVYFARGEYGSLELWKMPVEGGQPTRLNVPPIYDWGFHILGDRLYFTSALAGGTYPVMALDLRSGKTESVARIGFSPFAKFAVSPDGKWLVYSQQGQLNSDLMLVDDFR